MTTQEKEALIAEMILENKNATIGEYLELLKELAAIESSNAPDVVAA